jgi:predicted NBD/HSP70 family sugar kinase
MDMESRVTHLEPTDQPTGKVLAFDIGGTQVKYGVVNSAGMVSHPHQIPTQATQGANEVIARLKAIATAVCKEQPISGIAISTLGIIGPHDGSVKGACDAIPGYDGYPLQADFEQSLQMPTLVENDGNCVAVAEGWTGAAQHCQDYVAFTLGTGIGGGVVLSGSLQKGANGSMGEWGYMKFNGRVWEDYASLRGLSHMAELAGAPTGIDAKKVFAESDGGNRQMQTVVHQWFELLTQGIENVIYCFDPQRIVMGGGIVHRSEKFIAELRTQLTASLRPEFHNRAELVLAALGNQAGMVGAAKLWLLQHGQHA